MVHSHGEIGKDCGDTTVTDDTSDNNKNKNIDNVGVSDEYLPEKYNNYDATVNGDTFEMDKNENIYDVGVDYESHPDQNNNYYSTLNDDTVEKN